MIARLRKWFYSLPFFFASFFRSRWVRLGVVRKALLMYPVFVFMGGVLQSPLLGVVVGAVYELGFVGLLLFYCSVRMEGEMTWLYLVLGIILVVLCLIWLELLFFFIPIGP